MPDTEFPREREHQPQRGWRQLIIWPNSPKNYMKMEKIEKICLCRSAPVFHDAILIWFSAKSCGSLPTPRHGSKYVTALHFGGRAVFRCYPGFIIKGSTTSDCLQDGTWSNAPPICKGWQINLRI